MNYHNQNHLYPPLPPLLEFGRTPPFSRLVRLSAGAFANPLKCSMLTVNIEQCPRYEALSYTWGTEESQASIQIDGILLPVKPNLESALRHLRLPNQDRFLWIDAICINQTDIAEKNRQIQYMRQVYKHAARVIVWLGLKTAGVELAFQFASRIAELEASIQSDPSTSQGADWNTWLELMRHTVLDSPEGSMEQIVALFEREYFMRTWCVQEVVACSWAVARCEELEIPFFDILVTSRLVLEFGDTLFGGKPLEFWYLVYRNRLKQRKIQSGPQDREPGNSLGPLLYLLAGARDFRATDPRDKIFAFFGISDEGLDPVLYSTNVMTGNGGTPKSLQLLRKTVSAIRNFANEYAPQRDFMRPSVLKPDYNKSCVEVYTDFARHQIRASPRTLDILHHVHHNEVPGTGPFPSWVPKWFEPRSCSAASTGLHLAGLCKGHFRYFAVVHDNPLRGNAVHPHILSIDGFLIDQVANTSDLIQFNLLDHISFENIWQSLFASSLSAHSQPTYQNGEPLDVALCCTLGLGASGTSSCLVLDDKYFKIIESYGSSLDLLQNTMRADVAQFLQETYPSRGLNQPHSSSTATQTIPEIPADADRFRRGVRSFAHNRRAFLTHSGILGLGPKMMQPGDQICVLYGGRFPFVIRPTNDKYHHLFIGVCYLHDDYIMWGKACESVRSGHADRQFREQTFHIR